MKKGHGYRRIAAWILGLALLTALWGCGPGSQATFPDVEGYIAAPEDIYTTKASDNRLEDVLMYVDGKLGNKTTLEDTPALAVTTQQGEVTLLRAINEEGWDALTEGQTGRMYFLYLGFSEKTQTPAGIYIGFIPAGKNDCLLYTSCTPIFREIHRRSWRRCARPRCKRASAPFASPSMWISVIRIRRYCF